MAPPQKKTINFDHDFKKKKAFFKRMFPGFKKKATELSVLCDNSVGFICYGPGNDGLHVWPEPEKNPQALPQIVSKFHRQSDRKRKNNNACDLNDFLTTQNKKNNNFASGYSPADLKDLSVEEIKAHLSNVKAQLFGVRQKKTSLLLRNSEPSELACCDFVGRHLQISDSPVVSNHEVDPSKNRSTTRLGFDELSCVVRGFNESALEISDKNIDVSCMEEDSSPLDLVTLGFYGGDNLPAVDSMGVTCTPPGIFDNDHVWDWEFSSTLPPLITCDDDDGYDQLLGITDSSMPNTCQTSMIQN